MKKNGITLIVLVIVIIVTIILSAAIILNLTKNNPMDSAKKAKFFNDLSTIEDGVKLDATSQYDSDKPNEELVPNFGKVTDTEKDYILNNIPTLDETIKIVNDGKDMYQTNLYWLDTETLGISGGDKNTKYLIDMDSLIPYDYSGRVFENKKWHTIRYGVQSSNIENGETSTDTGELPTGWMRLILHYPEDSTDRMWRLAVPGEVRDNASEEWQLYTGPILIKLENIPYVLIKYNLNGEEIITADTGKVAIDISTEPKLLNDKVTVTIKYDALCINKHYKIGDSGWKTYTGPFEVTEAALIQARADKEVDLKDTNGNVIGTTTISGEDKYQIRKAPERIVPDITLAAPKINKLSPTGTEKARITIDYPTNLGNIRKIYKLNSGAEVEYTGEFKILEYGTEITAYYYTEDNRKSQVANLTIKDETKLDVEIFVEPEPSVNTGVFETKAVIEYDQNATSKTYKIDSGAEQVYTGPITVNKTCTITAYARKNTVQATDVKNISFDELRKPDITYVLSSDKKKATVSIKYDANAVKKQYNIDGGELQDYTTSFDVTKNGTVIYAMNNNSKGDIKDVTKTITGIEAIAPPVITETPNVDKTKATISISYATNAVTKQYSIDGGTLQDYTAPFEVTNNGTVIKAVNKDAQNNEAEETLTVTCIQEISAPIVTQALSADKTKATISISFDASAITKQYSIDGGTLQNYTVPFDVDKNGAVIYAINTDSKNESKDVTYTVSGIVPIVKPVVTKALSTDETKATISIAYASNAATKQYSINGGALQDYTAPFDVTENGAVIYAVNTNSKGDSADVTFTVSGIVPIAKPVVTKVLNADNTKATISISYAANAATKQYNINGGALQDYTVPFDVTENGAVIYAVNTTSTGESTDVTYTVSGIVPIIKPVVTKVLSSDETKATISIEYAANAATKQYSIDGGALQNYTAPFDIDKNGTVIYAVNTTSIGESADVTYTVSGIIPIAKPVVTQVLSADKTKVTISIAYAANAATKQYSIDGGALQNYTAPFDIDKNGTVIYAVNTTSTGESADVTYTVSGIREITSPVITGKISSDNSKSTITIKYDTYATVKQYSINGGALQNYTTPFDVTENGTVIYAINTNSKNETKDATYTVTGIVDPLTVSIIANPDTEEEVSSVNVSISYDSRATVKQYSINGGELQNYTAPFNITGNSTIKAVASFTNGSEIGYGEATKIIDNLPTGVAAPVFSVTKALETEGEYAIVSIEFDKKSISNTYCINDGTAQNYIGPIEVRVNDTVISAYSVDIVGNSESAQKTITGLTRYLLIDKDKYYHVTLPYPENSINHEYRYTDANPWKTYPEEDGFILVKSQYEAELIQDEKIIKLEVEPGRYVDFTGHWYIVDENFLNLSEDIEMRWDYAEGTNLTRLPLQIIPSTTEPTDKVDIFIIYPKTAISKQYKINNGTYQNYTGKLTITENNTTIYAKTQYADGTWSAEKSYLVSNIVPATPAGVITMTPNISTYTNQNVLVDITFEPNSAQLKKKYKTVINGVDSGWQYVAENSKQITMTSNGTVFAAFENNIGESSDPQSLNVTNIDRESPVVVFGTNGASNVQIASTTVTVNDVGTSGINASTLQYVWDTQNTTTPNSGWTTFTNGATITKTDIGTYYLWVKAADNVGNSLVSKSNAFTIVDNVVVSTVQSVNKTFSGATTGYSYNNPVIPAGFVAVNTIDASWNTLSTSWNKGLVIQDTYQNQFVWVPVDGGDVPYAKWCTTGVAYNDSNITDDTMPSGFSVTNITTTYKGFYVARYESAFDYNGGNIRVASKKSTNITYDNWSTTRNATYNGYLWNYINSADAKAYSASMATSYGYDTTKVGTNLINGTQWDTIMKWIQWDGKGVSSDSRSWGNFDDSRAPANVSGYGYMQISGYSNYWKAKNIYDMAGNLLEFTNEKYSSWNVSRGGLYADSGFSMPAADRNYSNAVSPSYTFSDIGFRVALFVK